MTAQNDFGWTALYLPSAFNRPEILGPLLQAGADPRIAANGGRTPLNEARNMRNDECIQLLEVGK